MPFSFAACTGLLFMNGPAVSATKHALCVLSRSDPDVVEVAVSFLMVGLAIWLQRAEEPAGLRPPASYLNCVCRNLNAVGLQGVNNAIH
jgi:hypothetical protein